MASAIKPTSYQTTEADMKTLIRNALMVAGNEMGDAGDHWPVVKNTITDIMRDWEELEIERTVHAEIRTHLYAHLSAMEELLKTCTSDVQEYIAPRLAQLRDVYDAAFDEPEETVMDLPQASPSTSKTDEPIHYRRAEAILDTLFDDNTSEECHG